MISVIFWSRRDTQIGMNPIYLSINPRPFWNLFLAQEKGGHRDRISNFSSNMKLLHSKSSLQVLVFLLMIAGLVGQGKGTTCGTSFFSALIQMIPCRAAVAPFSPIPPSEACCNAVKTLGQPCLCVLVNGPPISGVDRNMAMLLPEKCTTNFDPCEMEK